MEVRCITFIEAQPEIRAVRDAVFGGEQNVPADINWDGKDEDCLHVVARMEDSRVIGTGRLEEDGKIGRLAVLPEFRGKGIGRSLLVLLIEAALRKGLSHVYLHAQRHALPFYEGLGFEASPGSFDEAGIEHRYMSRVLK